jgi:shikimate dehydrogenase
MLANYSGSTRIVPIVGHPIAQVKAPVRVTDAFERRGVDAICVPIHVLPANLKAFMEAFRHFENASGLILTVPHKLAAYEYCDDVSDLARFLRSINVIRRTPDGRLYGDMFDGIAMLTACRASGCAFEGRRALLVGAGGAGTAIAHAIATAGVSELVISDVDRERSAKLAERLAAQGHPVRAGKVDSGGFDIVINATPLGMRAGDELPIPATMLAPGVFVGDVVTVPSTPPLIVAARAAGCGSSTGSDMSHAVCELMVDFLIAGAGHSDEGQRK